jgi:hypothetical protein
MSIELTPRGQRAEQILAWMWENTDLRAEEAARKLNELASECEPGSRELTEVQDAGQIVARTLAA